MRQTGCKHCGHDIEGTQREGWRDRGGSSQCPEFCGWDEDGVAVYRKRRKHAPQSDRNPIRPTRWAPPTPGRPALTGG